MYEIIKDAATYGLNRVYANAQEFISVIEELRTIKRWNKNFWINKINIK